MNISSLACYALSEINLCQAVLWHFLYFPLLSFFFFFKVDVDLIQTQSAQMGFWSCLCLFPFLRLPYAYVAFKSFSLQLSPYPLHIFLLLVTTKLQPIQRGWNQTQGSILLPSPAQPSGFCLLTHNVFFLSCPETPLKISQHLGVSADMKAQFSSPSFHPIAGPKAFYFNEEFCGNS